jgi:hypothetical protein
MKGVVQPGPRVGIFWFFQGRLIADWAPLGSAEAYGDCLTHACSHIDFWNNLQHLGTVPRDIEYEQPPRGRVVFNTRTERFTLYADRCILARKSRVNQILRAMHLPPSQTDVKMDGHYLCCRCLKSLHGLGDED